MIFIFITVSFFPLFYNRPLSDFCFYIGITRAVTRRVAYIVGPSKLPSFDLWEMSFSRCEMSIAASISSGIIHSISGIKVRVSKWAGNQTWFKRVTFYPTSLFDISP